jgi:predicted porin
MPDPQGGRNKVPPVAAITQTRRLQSWGGKMLVKRIAILMGCIAAVLTGPALADGFTYTSSDGVTLTFYGLLDAGFVTRNGSDGLVPPSTAHNDFESGAGSGGSRIGLKLAYPLPYGITAIGETEWGFETYGDAKVNGSGATGTDANGAYANFIDRHTWLGATSQWGTLIGGKLDGARASVLKEYDPFQGASVACAGCVEIVTSRAPEAAAYITPSWHGLSAILAYTSDLFGVDVYNSESPVYAFVPSYKQGPVSVTYDHEEEWFRPTGSVGRLKLDVFAASYDFTVVKLLAFAEHITVAQPANPIAYFQDHKGYMVGATVPVGVKGLLKASWVERDSTYIDNKCSKYGVGYQYNLTKKAYLYTDYARIANDTNGSCTIAYTNEQTSTDLGTGNDAGGYGIQGVDIGFVLSF